MTRARHRRRPLAAGALGRWTAVVVAAAVATAVVPAAVPGTAASAAAAPVTAAAPAAASAAALTSALMATSAAGPVRYAYDAAGRLTTVTDTAGASATYAYDAVGNITGVTRAAAPTTTSATTTSSTQRSTAFADTAAETTPSSSSPSPPRSVATAPAPTAPAPTAPAPTITSAKPLRHEGEPALRIDGKELTGSLDAPSVSVGSSLATVVQQGPRSLVVLLPPTVAASDEVTVRTDGGSTSAPVPATAVTPPAPSTSVVDDVPWTPLTAPKGTTAVSGIVRDSGGHAVAGVRLQVGDVHSTSQADGRFILTGVAAGHGVLVIDGRPSAAQPVDYGEYRVGVDAVKGTTTAMRWTTWLTPIDTAHAVTIPVKVTQEVVVTTPEVPGLEVHVPPGTTFTADDGSPVTSLSITKLPLARQPFPGAPGMPLAWTIQPAGVRVGGAGLSVVYPNLTGQPPGTRIDYVNHDSDRPGAGWSVYGRGVVSADGTQITPDSTTRLYAIYLLGVSYNPLCKLISRLCPPTGDPSTAGDPVDLHTGLFAMSKSDLALPDVQPIALTRTYRQADSALRSFGVGQSDAFNSFVSPDNSSNYVVQFPDGSAVTFEPQSDGTYRAAGTPSAFYGAVLTTPNQHRAFTVTLVDGTAYGFDGFSASLVSITSPDGSATLLTRDGAGRVTRVTSPSGRWIALTWGSCTRSGGICITKAVDNLRRTVTYAYDGDGRLVSATDPAGKATTYQWATCSDSATCTQMTSVTDPLGVAYVKNTYDSNGRVSKQLQADGKATTFSYTTSSTTGGITATTVTDPLGLKRRVSFNSDGYTTADVIGYGTSSAQTVKIARRSGTGLVTSTTDPLGRVTAMTYDSAGNVTKVTELSGTSSARSTTFTYESARQRVASVTNPLGQTAKVTYDDDEGTQTSRDPLGRTTTVQLSDGQPVSTTDALGRTSTVSYLDGQPVTAVDALGRTASWYYDAGGRLLRATDPTGALATYSYDVLNQVTASRDPLGAVTKVSYDANGQVLATTDPLGRTTSYTYDKLGRPTSTKDALGASQTVTYDAAGQVVSATDRNGTTTAFSYDLLGRPTFTGYGKVTTSSSSTTYESSATSTYDAGNRLTQVVDTAGGTITQAFDAFDRLTSQTTPAGTTAYTYDAVDRRTGMTVSGQTATSYAYDKASQLTSITRGSQTVGFTYDAAGQRTATTLPGGITQAYAHDSVGQLAGITYSATTGGALGSLTYEYDLAGRPTTVGGTLASTTLPPAQSGLTYNAVNALTKSDSTALTYDAEGQLLSDGASTYRWNARGQLASLGGSVPASFSYDALGRRASRTVSDSTVSFLYDGVNPVQERTGSSVSADLLTGMGVDETFTRTAGGSTSSLLTDRLGSTVALASGSGTVATSYAYTPYGASSSSGASSSNPVQFAGRENDGTGLYYNRARYYSPTLQRFISQDPAGAAGSGNNLYNYAEGAPTVYTDPSGLMGTLVLGCVAGAGFDVATGWFSNKLSGRKYTLRDGLIDAGIGCATGALGPLAGRALGAMGRSLAKSSVDVAEGAAVSSSRGARAAAGDTAAQSCKVNSFDGDTPVAMADGTQKPISEVQLGERVVATDPESGVTGVRSVTALIRHGADHSMVRVLLADGSSIDATVGHPFWNARSRAFENAGALEVGDDVRAASGALLRVVGLEYSRQDLTAYNLEIEGIHTYYVGATPVLVHNACGDVADDYPFIIDSARKHGVFDEDIRHAYDNSLAVLIGRNDLPMHIGPDLSGNLLEVGVAQSTKYPGRFLFVHAKEADDYFLRQLGLA